MKHKAVTGLTCLILAVVGSKVMASETLRYNPFEQPDMTADGLQKNANNGKQMKLRGTVIDGDDSLVNISGKFYRLNQEVAGYRVIRIRNSSVTLRRGSKDTVLTLNDDE